MQDIREWLAAGASIRAINPAVPVMQLEREGHYFGGMKVDHDPDAAERDAALIRDAAISFVRKLDVIHADPQYQSLWVLTANRGMPYTGPDYSGEFQSLKHRLGLYAAAMAPHAGGIPSP